MGNLNARMKGLTAELEKRPLFVDVQSALEKVHTPMNFSLVVLCLSGWLESLITASSSLLYFEAVPVKECFSAVTCVLW